MKQSGETVVAAKCPKRFQLMFLQACAVTLLVWLVLYTLADADTPSSHHENSWSFTGFLRVTADTVFSFSKRPEQPRKRMLVLLWNSYFSQMKDWLPTTVDLNCPVSDCDVTSDRSLLLNSSAVIMHWRNIDLSDLPSCDASSCPLWVLFNKEAPTHTNSDTLQAIESRIHWTATYRRDSDVFAPYGKVIPRITPDYSETALDPSKRLVCWVVSNCNTPSNRESYVNELEDYIEVDVYGKCGNKHCPHKTSADCYKWLSKKCLFYLSLENSICRDYTTEKLYNALSTDMIPIVMGNASNYRHLPPNSYINALDFSGPKELAEHLFKVSKDEKLYQSYLVWKVHYEAKDHSYKWYCDLCAMLHSTDTKKVKPRNHLVSWWFDQSSCWSWQK